MQPEIIAAYSIKGGVGKTATAIHLAHLSALGGAATLLWDLDPQAAATYTLRVAPKVAGGRRRLMSDPSAAITAIKGTDYERLDLLPADFSYRNLDVAFHAEKQQRKQLRRLLEPLGGEYRRVILDCAPGITLVSENVFDVADVLVVPTLPNVLSVRMLAKLLAHRKQAGWRAAVLPFFNMVDRRKATHRDAIRAAGDLGVGMLASVIPNSGMVERVSSSREPVTAAAPQSAAAKAWRALWQEIETRGEHSIRRQQVKRLLREMTQPGSSSPLAADPPAG